MEIEFIDNSAAVLEEFEAACMRALIRCGMQAEGYAKELCPVGVVNGGNLRNSITHKVATDEKAAYVGTNAHYGAYVELGTGKYYEGGRQTPWVYQDDEGNWHHTEGQRAQPFLKPAVANHKQTYKNIIDDEMRNG